MRLRDIVKGVNAQIIGNEDLEITGLCHQSQQARPGYLFFAIDGTRVNGLDYAGEAIANGAVAVVAQRDADLGCTIIKTDDVRAAMSQMASNFYGNPSRQLLMVGVTGTNGKTTTTYMLRSIFEAAGKKVGIIGTNGVYILGQKVGYNMTTPDPIQLQFYLCEMVKNGVEICCMEVSAHALELQKLWGVMTDIALFTNLSQDHLDFFKSMEEYFMAKAKLFNKNMCRMAVINIDDDYGRRLFNKADVPVLTYGMREENSSLADIFLKKQSHNNHNQQLCIKTPKGCLDVELNLLGGFNIQNAMAAIGGAMLAGIEPEYIVKGLASLSGVDGRFNTIERGGVLFVIDFAHTPDGLENILRSARELGNGRLIAVFGCGGNRDCLKRPIMGKIASGLVDFFVITSDNPRYEDPLSIAVQIAGGAVKENYIIEIDREAAIKKAFALAQKGDVIVVAGKGAEPYMETMGQKVHFSDRKIIEKL